MRSLQHCVSLQSSKEAYHPLSREAVWSAWVVKRKNHNKGATRTRVRVCLGRSHCDRLKRDGRLERERHGVERLAGGFKEAEGGVSSRQTEKDGGKQQKRASEALQCGVRRATKKSNSRAGASKVLRKNSTLTEQPCLV